MPDQRTPLFERRISVGNILTILLVVMGGIGTWYTLEGKVNLIQQALAERAEDIQELETRIRKSEDDARKIDGRLIRIETQLERILKAVEGERR